jgi:hypothetical protein
MRHYEEVRRLWQVDNKIDLCKQLYEVMLRNISEATPATEKLKEHVTNINEIVGTLWWRRLPITGRLPSLSS